MYLGRLANGSGDTRRLQPYEKRRAAHGGCRAKNPPAYDWTAAKVGLTPGQQGIFGKYVGHYARPPTPEQHKSVMDECANAYPKFLQFKFQEAARKLIPTAEETAEAFVEEIKNIAPTVPVEMPTVVTPPDSRLAPPAPLATTMPVEPPLWMTIPRGEVPPRMVTTPVDSIPGAEFPLMERYRREAEGLPPLPAADATPPAGAPPPPKKGAGIGAALLVGIPIVLAMAG